MGKYSKIAFDIDGVIADSYNIFGEELLKKYNFDINTIKKARFEIPGVDWDDIVDTFRHTIQTRNSDVKPNIYSKFVLTELYKTSHEPILFVTARNILIEQETRNWIDKHFGKIIKYEIIHKKGIHKIDVLIDNDIDMFVEDDFDNATIISSYLEKVFLINKHYNIHQTNHIDNIIRVEDLMDVFWNLNN